MLRSLLKDRNCSKEDYADNDCGKHDFSDSQMSDDRTIQNNAVKRNQQQAASKDTGAVGSVFYGQQEVGDNRIDEHGPDKAGETKLQKKHPHKMTRPILSSKTRKPFPYRSTRIHPTLTGLPRRLPREA